MYKLDKKIEIQAAFAVDWKKRVKLISYTTVS